MKFFVPNYSCLQNPRLGGYRPQIPVLFVFCPQLNLLNSPPNKIPGYTTDSISQNSTDLIYIMVEAWRENIICCPSKFMEIRVESITPYADTVYNDREYTGYGVSQGSWTCPSSFNSEHKINAVILQA